MIQYKKGGLVELKAQGERVGKQMRILALINNIMAYKVLLTSLDKHTLWTLRMEGPMLMIILVYYSSILNKNSPQSYNVFGGVLEFLRTRYISHRVVAKSRVVANSTKKSPTTTSL
ncbi:MAG: hypothetical protein WAM14_17660 [Candidatus Nitrosopolaris sp.]